ncbi:MAG: MmcQ-like protein [Flavobacteriales bacterium]|nr:MmcQ-like protein [Flavobacteriales bacterium]
MNIEEYRDFCLSLIGCTESTPFGPDVLVFKVGGKMFSLCDIKTFERINLKSDPEKAIELRERHAEITPGYHMNKEHWNSVDPRGSLKAEFIFRLTKDSYNLIVSSLPKKQREPFLPLD